MPKIENAEALAMTHLGEHAEESGNAPRRLRTETRVWIGTTHAGGVVAAGSVVDACVWKPVLGYV